MPYEVLVLERKGDPDDSMFSCYTGTINGSGVKTLATFWEGRRAEEFIGGFLNWGKTAKSIIEYESVEEVIKSFLEYCQQLIPPPIKE